MRIAIYARKSRMTDKGESIHNQIILCKQYAMIHFNEPVFDEYQDEGYSGGNIKRPGFQQLIEKVKNKAYDILICYRLDRISRNVLDFSSTLETLTKYNVHFVSIKENFDTTTPMGRAMLSISSVFAQLERETIAERIKDNMFELAKTGRWLGGTTPLGYISSKTEQISNNGQTKKLSNLIPNPHNDYIVKLIFEKYLQLGSLSALENYLIQHQIKTRTNTHFRPHSLRCILANPVYCQADKAIYAYYSQKHGNIANGPEDFTGEYGLMVYNKNHKGKANSRNPVSQWIIAVGSHPPLILSDDWLQVQTKLSENSSLSIPSKSTHRALCSGLLYCKTCGVPMKVTNQAILKNGTNSYIYRCSNKLKSHGTLCNIANVKGHILDQALLNMLKSFIQHATLLKLFKEQLHIYQDNTQTLTHEISRLTTQINKCDVTISKLILLITQTEDASLRVHYEKEIKNQTAEKENLTTRLIQLNTSFEACNNATQNIHSTLNTFNYLLMYFDQLTLIEKQNLLKILIHHIDWDGTKIKVYFYNDPIESKE